MVAKCLLVNRSALCTFPIFRAGSCRSIPAMACRLLIYEATSGTALVCSTSCSINVPAVSLCILHDGSASCTDVILSTCCGLRLGTMTIRRLPDRITSGTNHTLSSCSTRPVPGVSQGSRNCLRPGRQARRTFNIPGCGCCAGCRLAGIRNFRRVLVITRGRIHCRCRCPILEPG